MPLILHSCNARPPLLWHMALVLSPLPSSSCFATWPLHCSGSRPSQGIWGNCTNIDCWKNQAHPSHPGTHRNHGRTVKDPTNSWCTNAEAGCTMSKGGNYSTPRVPTKLNNITTPNAIRQMPLVHQHHTRNNNPFHILSDNDDNDDTIVTSNCSPSAPPITMPSSIPPVIPSTGQAPHRLTSPPPISPSTVPPRCQPTTPPPRGLAT